MAARYCSPIPFSVCGVRAALHRLSCWLSRATCSLVIELIRKGRLGEELMHDQVQRLVPAPVVVRQTLGTLLGRGHRATRLGLVAKPLGHDRLDLSQNRPGDGVVALEGQMHVLVKELLAGQAVRAVGIQGLRDLRQMDPRLV